jgi:hypothetical protein
MSISGGSAAGETLRAAEEEEVGREGGSTSSSVRRC